MKMIALLLFSLLLSSPACAMVYSWIDTAGVAHFSNKEYEIPPRYRARAKQLYPEQGDSAATTQSVPNQPPIAESAPPLPPPPLTPAVQQAQPPAEPAKSIAPVPQKSPLEQKSKRGRRSRSTSED